MPILPEVGRKSVGLRIIIFCIYAILIIGSFTMIYPFAIMMGSSLTTDYDFLDFEVIPRYIYQDEQLRIKHLAQKYGGDYLDFFRSNYRLNILRYDEVNDATDKSKSLPVFNLDDPKLQKRLADWREFKKDLPRNQKVTFFYDGFLNGQVQKLFQNHLREKYNNDIKALDKDLSEDKDYFEDIDIVRELTDGHRWRPELTPLKRLWDEFKVTIDPNYYLPIDGKSLYLLFLETEFSEVDNLNKAWGTTYDSFVQVPLPWIAPPEGHPQRPAWEEFVRKKWPVRWLRLKDCAAEFHNYLATTHGDIERYNRLRETRYASFEAVPFPATMPDDALFDDWCGFIDTTAPVDCFEIRSVEALYTEWLEKRFASLDEINSAYGTSFAGWTDIIMPHMEEDYDWFIRHKSSIRWNFITGNYQSVMGFIALKGWALWNTLILVIATILTQLTIMPMAAFALSRFRLRYTHRILLYLLATMAFPAEVAMIPNFLLMKEFHMLNTYWALILPGVANGFGIFLLKGFFDSLPDELYEAGIMDGASEWTLFFKITLPLSKPILAVIALGAFGGAYGGFMWAFLICQQEKMWTLMVFLYQFQQTQGQPVVMASLVIAAIPTLLVFIFCQNIILRGIVIPMTK